MGSVSTEHGPYASEVTELGKRIAALDPAKFDVTSLEAEMGQIAAECFVEYATVKFDVYGVLKGQPGNQAAKLSTFERQILPTKRPID